MNIRDGNHRKVSFDRKGELGDKIDKLAMMIGKLAARDSSTVRQFKPQIHQGRGRGQNRNYNERNYQSRYREGNRSNVMTEDGLGKINLVRDMTKTLGRC